MSSKGPTQRLKNGLTPKENKLKNVLLRQIKETGQMNKTQAGLEVYDTKNKDVARTIVYETLQKPAVKDELEKALNSAGISVEKSIKNLANLADAQPVKHTDAVVYKSNMSILKLLGVDINKKASTIKHTYKQKVEQIGFDSAKNVLTKTSVEATELIQDVS